MNQEDYAVVIGLSKYPSISDLDGTDNDARAFRDWLVDPAGGHVPPENVKVILSADYAYAGDPRRAMPDTGEIDQAFEALIDRGIEHGGRTGRRLYMFFAGHGLAPDLEETALLMANARIPLAVGHHIPGRLYARWFQTAAFFEEVVLFMDCCRDNYPRVPWHMPPWGEIFRPRAAKARRLYGFATEWSRKSRTRPDPDPAKVHGYFTLALLEGLYGAARDAAGAVTSESLARFVYNRLPELTGADEWQEPRFEHDPDRPVTLVAGVAEAPAASVEIRLQEPVPSVALQLINGVNVPEPLPAPDGGAVRLSLSPGLYLVRLADGTRQQFFQVTGTEPVHVLL